MDDREDREAAEDHGEMKTVPEWDTKLGEGRDEKPLVEPFDPCFGRRPKDGWSF